MKRMPIFMAMVFLAIFILSMPPGLAQEEEPSQAAEPKEGLTSEENKSGLVTMEFEDADMRDVIRVIALASGLNMVIGEGVEAKVTISLKDVPWEKALDVILRTYNFSYKREENLIRIMTFEKVKQEERDVPLATKIFYLNFADVGEMKTTLSKSLSDRGSIETDQRTNSMVVTDIPTRIDEIEKIAQTLDTRTPQVMIEAMLVDVKLTNREDLGINWNIIHVDRHVPLGSDDDATSSWKTKTSSNNYIQQDSDLSNIGGNAIRFGFLQQLGTFRLEGLIRAWAYDSKAKILASPKVLTLDNQTASIEIILEIPYVSDMGEQGNTSYSFKEVGTKLDVTPHITSGGFVSMNLKPEMSYQSGSTSDGQPIIDTRKAETNVLVKDGETVVIGGLRRIDDTKSYDKVPILGDIPFLGSLFRKKDTDKIDTELLMFVTPHVIVKPHLRLEEEEKFYWLDEMAAERKRQEESKKQVWLFDQEFRKKDPLPLEERTDLLDAPVVQPDVKQEKIGQDLEKDKGYIYAW